MLCLVACKLQPDRLRSSTTILLLFVLGRAVGTSENQGVLCSCNLLLLVEIGFTDLPKSGGVMAPLAPPAPTGLAAATVRD